MNNTQLLGAFVIAIGLALCGFFAGMGIVKSKTADRFVTVKGLAEREVTADRAIWPVTFSITSNELTDLKSQLDAQSKTIQDFFISSGLKKEEISLGVPSVTDNQANYYGGNNNQPFRYIGKGKITVQTDNIAAINTAMTNISDLFGEGIVIEQDEYRNRIDYQFLGLNEIKPEMIQSATQNACEAAEQFANDANAAVRGIRRATQGYFSISDRDSNTPYIKNVRVVTTVEYYLD